MGKRFFKNKAEVEIYFERDDVEALKKWHEKNGVFKYWEETLFQLEHGLVHRPLSFDKAMRGRVFSNIHTMKLALENLDKHEFWMLTCAEFYAANEFDGSQKSPLETAGVDVGILQSVEDLLLLCKQVEKMKVDKLSHRPPSPFHAIARSLAKYLYGDLGIRPTKSATGSFGELLRIVLQVMSPEVKAEPKASQEAAVDYVNERIEKGWIPKAPIK